MTIIGTPRSFYKKFKFTVEIDGFTYFGFQKCSELAFETATVEHREGGTLLADKSAGLVTVPDIELTRGATKDLEMYNWAKLTSDITANAGQVEEKYKKQLDIVQRDRANKVLRRWRVFGAFVGRFSAGDWDNDADENVIESATLVIDSFKPIG